MNQMFYSIIVVCLNPGKKLLETLASVLGQTETSYEVIVKDGGSADGSLETVRLVHPSAVASGRIRLLQEPDAGIYDAMNQAVRQASGKYFYFLNCGDTLQEETVLERMRLAIEQEASRGPHIFYGNQYNVRQGSTVYSAPQVTDFTCYRNVPCHQVCFYEAALFQGRGYLTEYRVRADYEHFLYCIYERKAAAVYVPLIVSAYEGGGFSETAENRRISEREHREIAKRYLGAGKALCYRLLLWLTLAPLRTRIAESPRLSGIYNRVKARIYQRKKPM